MNKDGTSRILLDHEFAMELYRRGLTDAEIAKQSGVYVKTVGKWRNRMGLPANKKRRLKMSPVPPVSLGRGREKGDYRGL